MKRLLAILNIEFLIKADALKNWRMIFFLSTLALIMIASGHSADKKIFTIARLNSEIKALKSEFIENKSILLDLKKETTVTQNLIATGVAPSNSQSIKLIVNHE